MMLWKDLTTWDKIHFCLHTISILIGNIVLVISAADRKKSGRAANLRLASVCMADVAEILVIGFYCSKSLAVAQFYCFFQFITIVIFFVAILLSVSTNTVGKAAIGLLVILAFIHIHFFWSTLAGLIKGDYRQSKSRGRKKGSSKRGTITHGEGSHLSEYLHAPDSAHMQPQRGREQPSLVSESFAQGDAPMRDER